MSEQIQNPHVTQRDDPTNLDLHREQARHGVLLEELTRDVREIKDVLVGDDNRSGIVLDVDRLKQSRRLVHAVIWVVFTAIVGTTATLIAAYIH